MYKQHNIVFEGLKLSSKIFQTYTIAVDESTDAAHLAEFIGGCNPECVTENFWNQFLCIKLLLKKIFFEIHNFAKQC